MDAKTTFRMTPQTYEVLFHLLQYLSCSISMSSFRAVLLAQHRDVDKLNDQALVGLMAEIVLREVS